MAERIQTNPETGLAGKSSGGTEGDDEEDFSKAAKVLSCPNVLTKGDVQYICTAHPFQKSKRSFVSLEALR